MVQRKTMDGKKTAPYAQSGRGIPHPVTKVAEGASVPHLIDEHPTPVQPIVIQVPTPGRKNGNEVWLMILGVALAVVLSGVVALYISSAMSAEDQLKIDKLENRVEKLDQRNRDLNTRLTTLEARSEN